MRSRTHRSVRKKGIPIGSVSMKETPRDCWCLSSVTMKVMKIQTKKEMMKETAIVKHGRK